MAVSALIGSRVQRIDTPEPSVLAVSIADHQGSEVLVAVVGTVTAEVGLTADRPRGQGVSAFGKLLRNELEGARITAVVADHDAVTLWFGALPSPRGLHLSLRPRRGNAVLLDGDGAHLHAWTVERPARSTGEPLQPPGKDPRKGDSETRGGATKESRRPETAPAEASLDLDRWRATGATLIVRHRRALMALRRRDLRVLLKRARRRRERRLVAITADLARGAEVADLRRDGGLILSNLHRLAPHIDRIEITDYTSDPPVVRTLVIDARLGPRDHAERLFHRARRLERGAKLARERHQLTRSELQTLDALEQELEAIDGGDNHEQVLRPWLDRALRLGIDERSLRDAAASPSVTVRPTKRERGRDARAHAGKVATGKAATGKAATGKAATGKAGRAAHRLPYRAFTIHDGLRAWVGRGAGDNDALTLHHARPHHVWLHARGVAGAHVVVALDKGRSCNPEALLDAATLAAHFSDARGEPVVEVQHTERRYVRKPKGAAVGAVVLERERVLRLRVEAERLSRLLAAENLG